MSTRGVQIKAVLKFSKFSYGPKRDFDPGFRSPIEKRPLFMYSTMTGNFLAFFANFWLQKFFSPKVWLVGAQIARIREGVHLAQ